MGSSARECFTGTNFCTLGIYYRQHSSQDECYSFSECYCTYNAYLKILETCQLTEFTIRAQQELAVSAPCTAFGS